MSAGGICGDCSADPVNIENMCDPELCDTEKSIATIAVIIRLRIQMLIVLLLPD